MKKLIILLFSIAMFNSLNAFEFKKSGPNYEINKTIDKDGKTIKKEIHNGKIDKTISKSIDTAGATKVEVSGATKIEKSGASNIKIEKTKKAGATRNKKNIKKKIKKGNKEIVIEKNI